MRHHRRRRRVLPLRRGYSLAALFLLMATIAVVAAMASSVPSWSKVAWNVAIPNLVVGFLGGAILGGTLGIHYERRIRSTLAGIAMGAVVGLVAGALTIAEFSPLMALMQCAVLLALAVVVRIASPLRPAPQLSPDAAHSGSLLPELTQANRIRLLAAVLMAGCTVISIIYLVRGVQPTGSGIILVIGSLVATIFLFVSALRTRQVSPPQPARSSPWDE